MGSPQQSLVSTGGRGCRCLRVRELGLKVVEASRYRGSSEKIVVEEETIEQTGDVHGHFRPPHSVATNPNRV